LRDAGILSLEIQLQVGLPVVEDFSIGERL
jgi:hypothetical protein